MSKKIAVEKNLTGIQQVLREQGFTVVTPDDLNNVAAVIVMGADKNLMGIHDTVTKAPVIDATGKTPQEILGRINKLV